MTIEYHQPRPPAKWRPIVAIVIVAIALAYLGLRKVDKQTILEDAIHTSGHFFFFAMIAVLVAWSAPILLPNSRRRRYRFVLAFLVSVFVGALLEFAQYFLPYRSASMPDMMLDIYGAIAGAAAAAITSHLLARRQQRASSGTAPPHRPWHRRLLAPLLLVLASYAGMSSLGACLVDHYQRNRGLPTLLSATERWGQRFLWLDEDVELVRTKTVPSWGSGPDELLWEVKLPASSEYPGFGVWEPSPDWSSFETLAIDIENLSQDAIELFVRIHDKQHDEHHTDRFHERHTVEPGFQTLRLPLTRVKSPLPNGRSLDLREIEGVKWFLVRPTRPAHLRFANLRLE